LANHVKTKTYPSGHGLTYFYDVAGDPSSFNGNLGTGQTFRTYSSDLQYNPQGQMTREQFGTDIAFYHRRHYNARGQLFDVRLGTDSSTVNDGANPNQWTGTSWDRGALRFFYSSNYNDYAWPVAAPLNNNGNLYRQDIFVPTTLDAGGNITNWLMGVDYYGYDALNRLVRVDEFPAASWVSNGAIGPLPMSYTQYYKYDRFGNRLLNTIATWGIGINRKAFRMEGTIAPEPMTNRLKPPAGQFGLMEYDAAGNLTNDTYTGGGTRTYDAENRMLSAMDSNGVTSSSYVYDADGRRTRRKLQGLEWWQVYGVGGELVAEYSLSGSNAQLRKEYGYRNGQLLVVAESNGSCQWLVTDALGTPRMLVDQTGSLSGMKRRDYLPFGEEVPVGMGHRQASDGYGFSSSGPRQAYTGKERDGETELDYFEARYYSSVLGRFTSPDEFTGGPTELFAEVAAHNPTFYAELAEPQSLNKYAYCLNSPFKFVDPDGHQTTLADYVYVAKAAVNAAPTAADAARAVGKVFGNIHRTIMSLGGTEPAIIEGPSNETEARVMQATENQLFLSGFAGRGGAAGTMMGKAKPATTVTALGETAQVVRKAGGALTEPTLPPKTVIQQDGVKVVHYTASGDHAPAHLHVKGKGAEVRVGQNGKPLKNDPELSATQKRVVEQNKSTIRKAVDKIQRYHRFHNREDSEDQE
jgi:RHS repeat-associated protein